MEKSETTKYCRRCGSKRLVHLTSMNIKKCAECMHESPWFLDDGQQPLHTSSRDKDGIANDIDRS